MEREKFEWYPDYVKYNRSEGLETFISNVTKDINSLLKDKERKFWNNLTASQREAILDLSKDDSIIIKPADNGGAIVIMDSVDYKKGCLQILSDKEFYEELPENSNITYKKEIDAKVDTLLSNDIITEFEASNLTLGTRTPCFYGLPKIHKLFDHFPPLRPICSGYYSCTAKISEFVDAFLKPAAQHSSSYVRDTLDFIRKLETQVPIHINANNSFLVSMDVVSLYPNIDHEEGISACEEALTKDLHNTYQPLSYLISSKQYSNVIHLNLMENIITRSRELPWELQWLSISQTFL